VAEAKSLQGQLGEPRTVGKGLRAPTENKKNIEGSEYEGEPGAADSRQVKRGGDRPEEQLSKLKKRTPSNRGTNREGSATLQVFSTKNRTLSVPMKIEPSEKNRYRSGGFSTQRQACFLIAKGGGLELKTGKARTWGGAVQRV